MTSCIDISGLVELVYPRLWQAGSTGQVSLARIPPSVRQAISDVGELCHQVTHTVEPQQRMELLRQIRRILTEAESVGMRRSSELRDAAAIGRQRQRQRRAGVPESELRPRQGMPERPIPPLLFEIVSDLAGVAQKADRNSLLRLIREMSTSRSLFAGGEGVLDIVRRFGFQRIASMELRISGPVSERVYDIVLDRGRRRLLIEVKNWSSVQGLQAGRWDGAADQLIRDFTRGSQVSWIFRTQTPLSDARTAIADGLLGGVQRRLIVRSAHAQTLDSNGMRSSGRIIELLESVTDMQSLRRSVNERFHPVFVTGGQFSPTKHRQFVNAVRQFFENFNARVFINPG